MRPSNTTEWGSRRENKCRRNIFLGLAALALTATLGAQEPFQTKVRGLRGVDLVTLEDGRRVRLQGISLPTPSVRPVEMGEELKALLSKRLEGRLMWIFPEEGVEPGDRADLLAVLRPSREGPSINEEVLDAGLAVLDLRSGSREKDRLVAAASRAQEAGRGWWGRPEARAYTEMPYLNGAVLGLHFEADRDYHRHIDELSEAGFEHVCLSFSAFLADVEATRIQRHHPRTVREDRLIETITYAKGKGMSVLLMPILLLEQAGEDDWRGTIRPEDEGEFWAQYRLFMARYLDIAEATGVELFSVGSELGSLEDRTEAWELLIANARGRFRGLLTYSANWDHGHVPEFFPGLDVVGMSAYFSLTQELDPDHEELAAAWRRIGEEVGELAARWDKPVLFTELGYASQDGINRNPWNYILNADRIDLDEQARCFRAFMEVAPGLTWLRGAFFYDYFDEGGPEDPSYSPRGKPAMEEWRRWAAWGR